MPGPQIERELCAGVGQIDDVGMRHAREERDDYQRMRPRHAKIHPATIGVT